MVWVSTAGDGILGIAHITVVGDGIIGTEITGMETIGTMDTIIIIPLIATEFEATAEAIPIRDIRIMADETQVLTAAAGEMTAA